MSIFRKLRFYRRCFGNPYMKYDIFCHFHKEIKMKTYKEIVQGVYWNRVLFFRKERAVIRANSLQDRVRKWIECEIGLSLYNVESNFVRSNNVLRAEPVRKTIEARRNREELGCSFGCIPQDAEFFPIPLGMQRHETGSLTGNLSEVMREVGQEMSR